jgi:hypothetical protein
VTRWRWRIGPVGGPPARKGRWQPTAEAARSVAVAAGVAIRDEHSGKVYLHALADIERDDGR